MLKFDLLRQVLWIVPSLVQAVIIAKMIASGSRRNFPIFFNYLIYQTIFGVALQCLLHFGHTTYRQYFYIYWAGTAVMAVLAFAVTYEVFSNVFRPYDALRDFAAVMFRWAALVLVLVAIVQGLSTAGSESARMVVVIMLSERIVYVIVSGLLLFLLLFSRNLGLDWKQQTFGIAAGFGLCTASELVLWSMRLQLGQQWESTMNLCRSMAFTGSVLVWAFYMFSPDRARKTVQAFAPNLILERWNQVLRSVNRPAPQGAFMPNLEKIVDDVLAHQVSTTTVH